MGKRSTPCVLSRNPPTFSRYGNIIDGTPSESHMMPWTWATLRCFSWIPISTTFNTLCERKRVTINWVVGHRLGGRTDLQQLFKPLIDDGWWAHSLHKDYLST
jgi:hypothetical protein